MSAAALLLATTVFVNVNVVTMQDDQVLRDHVVVVDGAKIVAVAPKGQLAIPAGATVIDGEGGLLVPGLIDVHTHVQFPGDLSLYLANGVTTVANLGGDWTHLALRKNASAPRVVTCGPSISGVHDVAAAVKLVNEQADAGYDCIKPYDDLSAEALQAMVDTARKRGLVSIGHIPRNLTWQQVLAIAPDAIAHAEEFLYSPVDEGDDARIVEGMKNRNISLATTLVTYDAIGRQVADYDAMWDMPGVQYVAPVERREWQRPRNHYLKNIAAARVPNLRRLLGFQRGLVKQLRDGGVRILLGTDAGGPAFVVPGFSAIDELRQLVASGLTPYQALRAATSDSAAFLRIDAGTIEPGKSADLLLLRGNPLTNIDNIALRAGVMTRGRWLDQKALRALLDDVLRANHAEEDFLRVFDEDIERALRATNVREMSLHELGYQLWKIENRRDDALKVFRANAALHPESRLAKEALEELMGDG